MGFLDRFRRPGAEPAAADAGDDDELILAHLRRAGADLSQPRHVLHYLYLPTEDAAGSAASAATAEGYEATVLDPLPGRSEWGVRAEATAVVDDSTVGATRAAFARIAADHGGEYDGWEAAAQP